jgi:multidrug efflux pump subunit AcrA (membrane-fusion protein)
MDLHIDIEFREGLMLVTAHGSLRFDEASRQFKQVWDTAAENQVSKILVDSLAVEGELAIFERYDLGVEIAADLKQRQMNVKVAIVGRLPTVNGFGVRVARNRGVITEVFSTQQEALNWLDS